MRATTRSLEHVPPIVTALVSRVADTSGGDATANTTCSSGTYSAIVDISGFGGGALVVDASIFDTVGNSAEATAAQDGDNITSAEEDNGPNGGDINNDGTLDSLQANVTTYMNPVVDGYVATEVSGDCGTINSVSYFVEPDLATQDAGHDYPIGLHGIEAACSVIGGTVNITHYWDKEYDTDQWTYRKYIDGQYIDFNDQVTYGTFDVAGTTVTTVSFSVTDGGPYDADGVANGVIVDPVGPTVLAESLSETGSAAVYDVMSGLILVFGSIGLLFATRNATREG